MFFEFIVLGGCLPKLVWEGETKTQINNNDNKKPHPTQAKLTKKNPSKQNKKQTKKKDFELKEKIRE